MSMIKGYIQEASFYENAVKLIQPNKKIWTNPKWKYSLRTPK